jgi:hypothetical protein
MTEQERKGIEDYCAWYDKAYPSPSTMSTEDIVEEINRVLGLTCKSYFSPLVPKEPVEHYEL